MGPAQPKDRDFGVRVARGDVGVMRAWFTVEPGEARVDNVSNWRTLGFVGGRRPVRDLESCGWVSVGGVLVFVRVVVGFLGRMGTGGVW